jgi:hypothetical protein
VAWDDVSNMHGADMAPGGVADFDWLTTSESDCDTWKILGKWHGARWPNHGLPRGTRLLALGRLIGLLKFYGSVGVEPRTSNHRERFNIARLASMPYHVPCI